MSSLDQLKLTFFDECSEALQQMEAGLTEMQDGISTDDTINAIFRSVHSVKGGAGIFGFEGLVNFAHVLETVLDTMRNGKLTATHDIMDVLLQANDVLSDLITMSRSGEAIPPNHGSECRAALERLIGLEPSDDDDSPAPADFEGLDFMPVRVDDFDAPDAGDGLHTFGIVFRPKPEMLRKANEPLYIVRELRKLGELELVAETDALPHLTEIEPDRPYIGWTGTLRTAATRAQIEEVFEFVTGDCEIEIMEADPAPAFGGLGESLPTAELPGADFPLAPAPVEASMPAPAASREERAPMAQPSARTEIAETAGAPKAACGQGCLHHDPDRARTHRSRGEHGGRVGDRPGDAGSDRSRPSGSDERPADADPRRGHPPHAGAEGQRDVDARSAGRRGVPAHASARPRAFDQDVQAGPA